MPPSRQQALLVATAVPAAYIVYEWRSQLSSTLLGSKSRPSTPLNTPGLDSLAREVYIEKGGGQRELLITDYSRGTVSRQLIKPTKASTFAIHRQFFAAAKGKVGVNAEFLRQLRNILRICVPRSTSNEVFLFTLHSFFLLLRTYLSLLGAKLDGRIVKNLVSGDAKGFAMGLVHWYLLALPSAYTNSMIRYLQSKLNISFRTRLTRYIHDLYLSSERNFYKVLNLDTRLEGVDQYIATDIARFCDSLSSLYSNLSKPFLDLVLFNIQLGSALGKWGSIGLFASYTLTAFVLRRLTPAFGRLAAIEAKLEGEFRNAHSRLIINAEEIAFYDGQHLEKDILTRSYLKLIRHINSILKIRIKYGMSEDFIIKYCWSACGYCLISIPVFFGVAKPSETNSGKLDGHGVAERTQDYISNRRLLLSLADAGGRIMNSNKELAELAGYTSRVYDLLSTLHALNIDSYESSQRPVDLPATQPFYDLGHVNGRRVEMGNGRVEFDKVPVVAPAPGMARGGEELVKALNLRVNEGEHILITGPNGSGKTAIVRLLAGLWPVFEGVVRAPFKGDIFFLPQRPYLTTGSLREQIIYPTSYPDFVKSGKTDDDLLRILEHVHLVYLPGREGGLDTHKDWKDVLSGGEKQRISFARLFYHSPQFGVVDESTSAVSTDVEGKMYQHAKELKITLITVSHRPSLFKYHSHLLRLTGDEGKWELQKLGTVHEEATIQAEIDSIERKLQQVDEWRTRLRNIGEEMAFVR